MFDSNEYFDGKVKSLSFKTETNPATVGVMAIGDYIFNTAEKEKMTVVSGIMVIKFANADETHTFTAGESFEVEANSSFDVSVAVETAYLCLYG